MAGTLTLGLRERSIRAHRVPWHGDDPTDHRGVFEFLRDKLPELRRRFAGRELVLHISPGTPSMHTVWVLMAETGFIEPPFTVVKSYRRAERRGRPAAPSGRAALLSVQCCGKICWLKNCQS